ncbi:hypothetical protein FRC09_013008 [Ceratobasidium sp. 395]|nr:hypothetical protein FRC09_013008 [Ceratobasidium sp. 395]
MSVTFAPPPPLDVANLLVGGSNDCWAKLYKTLDPKDDFGLMGDSYNDPDERTEPQCLPDVPRTFRRLLSEVADYQRLAHVQHVAVKFVWASPNLHIEDVIWWDMDFDPDYEEFVPVPDCELDLELDEGYVFICQSYTNCTCPSHKDIVLPEAPIPQEVLLCHGSSSMPYSDFGIVSDSNPPVFPPRFQNPASADALDTLVGANKIRTFLRHGRVVSPHVVSRRLLYFFAAASIFAPLSGAIPHLYPVHVAPQRKNAQFVQTILRLLGRG